MEAKLDAIIRSLEDLRRGQSIIAEKLGLFEMKLDRFEVRLDSLKTKLDRLDEKTNDFTRKAGRPFRYKFTNLEGHKALYETIGNQTTYYN